MADGVFQTMMEARASGDPRRIRAAHDEAVTALECIGCVLNVVSDYAYLRHQNSQASLYASDYDVAQTLYTLADLTFCARSALVDASRSRVEKTIKEG